MFTLKFDSNKNSSDETEHKIDFVEQCQREQ